MDDSYPVHLQHTKKSNGEDYSVEMQTKLQWKQNNCEPQEAQ